MSQNIQPLRIQKGTPQSSPTKMSQRPLADLSPMERRRNSPSFNQNPKQMLDSSPFDSSPFASKFNNSPFVTPNSPHSYWQNRDRTSPTRFNAENRNPRDGSPVPAKRNSIENLMKASRVKNSTMFAREQKNEYDPSAAPVVERPLASGRPLSAQAQRSPFENKAENKLPSSPLKSAPSFPAAEPQKTPQSSPGKSSLSKNSRYGHAYDPDSGVWSEDEESFLDRKLPAGKSLHRHAKSVTFDAAPPEINEYEAATPDPSSVASGSREGSYDSIEDEDDESVERGSPIERDDSFDASLEDTDKTPVVLPEDWRFMSPGIDNDDEPTARMEDPFFQESSPFQTTPTEQELRASPARTNSVASNGERRPLPPLPPFGFASPSQASPDTSNGLRAAAERASLSQRNLPSPPRPSSISKADLQSMQRTSMSMEDRLHLMMLQDGDKVQAQKTATEEQRERRLRRAAGSPDRALGRKEQDIKIHEDEPEAEDEVADLPEQEEEYQLPCISRESILRKVKSSNLKDDYDYSSPAPSSSPERRQLADIDPDTPLPSLEDQQQSIIADDGVVIKREEDEESEVDVYAIPDMYRQAPAATNIQAGFDFGLNSKTDQSGGETDDESHYSTDLNGLAVTIGGIPEPELEGPPTPRAEQRQPLPSVEEKETKNKHRMSLPQFASMLGESDFGLDMSTYLTPSPPVVEPSKSESFGSTGSVSVEALPAMERPVTPTQQLTSEEEEEPKTPESVIRYSISELPDSESPEPEQEQEPEPIPEPVATIKAPGGKLKTRASLAPADVATMAETRRKVSGETPGIPPIPDRDVRRPSVIPEGDSVFGFEEEENDDAQDSQKQVKRKSSLVQLDLPVDEIDEGLSFGLDKEFDRLIEAQKVESDLFLSSSAFFSDGTQTACTAGRHGSRPHYGPLANANERKQKGYLMRQNTKVVVASSASHDSALDMPAAQPRMTKSAGNSPVKQSQAGTWTTEPWNGKIRRKSIRQSAGSPMKRPPPSVAPPLPGMPSNVSSNTEPPAENEIQEEVDEFDESGERGRLFIKVVGVKDLCLPLPRGERSYFALTLDNGLHCVTTAWLELGKNAPIGQEFELVVMNELEFQLTLQTKLEQPKPEPVPESPTKKVHKQSTFSKVFASPKKRKELELKQQEEAQRARQQEIDAKSRKPQTAWDLLHNLVGSDGSFARSYISLKDHESKSYGRPMTVDVPCFNEWAMEESRTMSSSRSGRAPAAPAMQRRAPYKIGKLELQLLYVPKPKEARDEDMPKSMNACVRELAEAERTANQVFEGHLSQQGGDCPYWRRRFFRLEGSKLTAYHDLTRQPRATISLAKASKLIDDKSSLTQKDAPGKNGGRRRSAFAADEEGYMFVEEGFRVRFANGETIDFYADSREDKEGWMRVLSEVVGKDAKAARWTDLVVRKERAKGAARAGKSKVPPSPGARKSSKTQPARPLSQQAARRPTSADKPLPPTGMRDPRKMTEAERRAKSRSMVF